jgi:glycosyltransferase involved in cell wall biosynthesis
MKIALFSPLPPKKTGIAAYSYYLAAALSEIAEVDVFDTQIGDRTEFPGSRVIDFATNPQMLTELDDYDGCVYQIGNNPYYHLDAYKVLLRKPGIVVLHDTVLYYLIAGLNLGGLVKEFCLNYGADRLDELWELIESCPDRDTFRYQEPHRYPLLKRLFQQATAIVVHSNTAKEQVRKAGYKGPVHKIEHLLFETHERFSKAELKALRNNLQVTEQEVVIGCFGFISGTKRLSSLLEALDLVKDRLEFKLLIVGEGDENELRRRLGSKNLKDKVIKPGFIKDEDFNKYLAATDIVVNLRFPSMGETSGTLIRAFSQNKPCIVTDHAWFSELPDNCVLKVAHDDQEVEKLAEKLMELASDPVKREDLGSRAREHVELHCSPQKIALEYLEVVRKHGSLNRTTKAFGTEAAHSIGNDVEDRNWVERYLIGRTRELLPPQPQSTRS